MRPFASFLIVIALAAAVAPAHAQTRARRPVIPPPAPTPPAANATSAPGLCQCLYPPSLPNDSFGKTHLHFACLGGVDPCKSNCNTTTMYSFIPTAPYSCASQAVERSDRVMSSQR